MGVLFARAFTQQGLLDAWQEVRERALADGRPDAEVERFERDAAHLLSELAATLLRVSGSPTRFGGSRFRRRRAAFAGSPFLLSLIGWWNGRCWRCLIR